MNNKRGDIEISVVVPCYNAGKYLDICLRSLFNQTVKPAEIIVVDDGSTDNSSEIASRYPVRLLRHDVNRGIASARNTGTVAAKGDVVLYIDADCVADYNLVENVLESFRGTNIIGVGGTGVEVPKPGLANRYRAKYLAQTLGKTKIVNPLCLFGQCFAFRKSALLNIGLFDPIFKTNAEDVDLCLRLRSRGCTYIYDPNIAVYHIRDDTLLTLLKAVFRASCYGVIAKLKNSVKVLPTMKLLIWLIRKIVSAVPQALLLRDPIYALLTPFVATSLVLGDIKGRFHSKRLLRQT